MVAVSINFISTDKRGIAYIDGTRIKVWQIAEETSTLQRTPTEVQEAHSHLTQAQIHAALSYYYVHQDEIDAQIAQANLFAEQMQQNATGQKTRAELEARRPKADAA